MERIALVGLPGCGKSTVARQLAARLGLPLLDADLATEARLGTRISVCFAEQGEAFFRGIEQEVLQELTQMPGVLSTGGGAVLREINRELLHNRCTVVYLHNRPETLAKRLRNDRTRPLLQVEDTVARMHALYAQRDSLYRQTAHLLVETEGATVKATVAHILKSLELMR